jgi:hypothetical protein
MGDASIGPCRLLFQFEADPIRGFFVPLQNRLFGSGARSAYYFLPGAVDFSEVSAGRLLRSERSHSSISDWTLPATLQAT